MARGAFVLWLGALVALGCRATVMDSAGGAGAGGAEAADATPPRPGPPHAGSGPAAAFAVDKLFFGDVDRAGRRDLSAWRDLGLDIDHRDTACSGEGCDALIHCQAREGAAPEVFADGNRGVDNSFGVNLFLAVLYPALADFSERIDRDLEHGGFTLLFAIDGLGPSHDYNPLAARFYRGAPLGHRPAFDGSDAWPVTSDSLSDPSDVNSALSTFASSWVTADTWVSGLGDLTLELPFAGTRVDLPIHHAMVTMKLSADRTLATEGTISGILDPDELASQAPRIAGAFDPALCDGKGVADVQRRVLQAADIRSDGDAGDRDVPCNGISIGLGFEAKRVELGPVAASPSLIDPCTD